MTFGNIVMAIAIGIGGGIGMYIAYGRESLRAQVGVNRLRNAIFVGTAVGLGALLVRIVAG